MCYTWANFEFFLNLCLFGLKFGMVRLDACIDGMGGFPNSKKDRTNYFTNQTTKL